MQAWQNETVCLKAAVSFQKNTEVTAEGDLYGAVHIPVTVSALHATEASLGFGTKSAPKEEVYDIISRENTIQGTGNDIGYYWISFTVPGNAPAGIYRGSVNITDGNETVRLKMTVNVLNLSLQWKDYPSLNLWQYPYSSYSYYDILKDEEPFSEKHLAVLKKEMQVYHDLGGRNITCTIVEEPWAHQTYFDTPSLITWNLAEDNSLWYDYSAFDAWVQLNMDLGIDERIDCFSILPFEDAITLHRADGTSARLALTLGSEEWTYYWQNFLQAFINHLVEKGWYEKTYLFIDERSVDSYQTALDLVHSVHDEQWHTMKLSSAVNTVPRDEKIFDDIESLSVSAACYDKDDTELQQFIAHRKEKGLQTTLYNCTGNYPNAFVVSDPAESVFFQMYGLSNGFDGYLRWAWNAWNAQPLVNTEYPSFEAGDPWLLYPDEANAQNPQPYLSVRLAMLERGRQDCAKYTQLQRLLEQEDASTLQDILYSLAPGESAYNAYGAVLAKDDEARKQTESETYRMETAIQEASGKADRRYRGNRYGRRLMLSQ